MTAIRLKARKTHKKEDDSFRGSMVENRSFGSKLGDALIILVLALAAFICVIPIWHVMMSSVSNGQQLFAHKGMVVTPVGEFNLGGYQLLFRDSSVMMGYLNTIIYVASGTALCVLMNIVGGYVLCRNSKLKGFMTIFIIITTMFNGGIVPTYMVIDKLGMTGTRWALIIPGATNAMFILLVMNTFASIDKSYYEAASIDGAGHLTTMFRVIFPQGKGMVLVTAINSAIMRWNSWFEASIYVPTDKSRWPLQLWVRQLTGEGMEFLKSRNPDYDRYLIQYAAIILSTLPILIALPFFIKKLEKGMVLGGVKG